MKLILDGTAYAVSPQFGAAIQHALGTLTFNTADVEAERLGLLARSNTRGFTERTVHLLSRDDDGERIERDVVVRDPIAGLSSEDQQRLTYITHVANVANAIRVVGAHHDPVKEWGLDGWDAVHGNMLKKHCGCEVHGAACADQPREDCDKSYGCEHHYVFDNHSVFNHFGHNRVTEEREHHEIAHHPCKAHAKP